MLLGCLGWLIFGAAVSLPLYLRGAPGWAYGVLLLVLWAQAAWMGRERD